MIADLPLDLGERKRQDGAIPLAEDFNLDLLRDSDLENDHTIWTSDLVSCLEGLASAKPLPSPRVPAAPLPPEALRDLLAHRGWESSLRDDGVRVSFADDRAFSQVALRDRAGLALTMELADATEWSADSFRAATHVAAAANIQLRLVRIVCTLRGPRRIFLAEVHLGALPPRSLWLDLALDALRATATVLALELPALSDPRLAQRVLQTPVLPPGKEQRDV